MRTKLTQHQQRNEPALPTSTITLRQKRRPVLCDWGEKAYWFSQQLYVCQNCDLVIRVSPRIGRVYIQGESYRQEHPGVLDRVEVHPELEVEDPAEY
jgi:hypothetical protein